MTKFHVGDIVKWMYSEDQLWVIILIQNELYSIRTLLINDGSFCTRIRDKSELILVQSGNPMERDITGKASMYGVYNLDVD